MVTLGPGVEIPAAQLEALKWTDYRKLTRGLAALVFTPFELATRSVTGQRWSRAASYGHGAADRKVKPALDSDKVKAIIDHVRSVFPSVEPSRIKQVLAYKCQESSVSLKMKAGIFGFGSVAQVQLLETAQLPKQISHRVRPSPEQRTPTQLEDCASAAAKMKAGVFGFGSAAQVQLLEHAQLPEQISHGVRPPTEKRNSTQLEDAAADSAAATTIS